MGGRARLDGLEIADVVSSYELKETYSGWGGFCAPFNLYGDQLKVDSSSKCLRISIAADGTFGHGKTPPGPVPPQ